jgi:hypothetical protein
MFRENPFYIKLLARFDKAIRQVGWEGDAASLVSSINVNGLEQVMLTSYRMTKYLRKYLKHIGAKYDEGYKVPDLYTAIERAMKITDGSTKTAYIDTEAIYMEGVSRAAYAWLKYVPHDQPN